MENENDPATTYEACKVYGILVNDWTDGGMSDMSGERASVGKKNKRSGRLDAHMAMLRPGMPLLCAL